MARKMTYSQFERKLKKISSDIIKMTESYIARYLTMARASFNRIQKESIGNWYGSYDPVSYHRFAYSLRKIPYAEIKNGELIVGFDSDRISGFHRVTSGKGPKGNVEGGKEYMYNTFFVGGWHGGATSGPPDKRGFNPFSRDFSGAYWRYPKDAGYPYWWELPATRYRRFKDKDAPFVDGDGEVSYTITEDSPNSVKD